MKKFLLILFAFISLNAFSQIQIKEGSFKKINNYVMLDKYEHTDINNNAMALIKITAEGLKAEERARLTFKGNMATSLDVEQKGAETYLYLTAKNATFIEILHPDYGKTERFMFPEQLCDFCGYEMVVQYNNPQPELGFLAISSEPTDADIYIDGKHYGKTNNVITDLSEGTHQLKLEKQGYVTLTKNINIVKGETLKLNETLQTLSSQKTFLIVKTDRPDARIYINDNLKNTGEHAESVLIGSTYTYRIECNLYHTETGSVTVNDKTTINKTLRPAFGYINITTSPEQGAKVFIDGDYIGLSPIKTDKLASGTHKVMVMKEMYNMKEQSFTVNDGQTTNATLNMSANFVTLTLTVDSDSDTDADIYVDEEYKGKGRWTGRLSEGLHNIEAKKANHRTSKKTLDLVSGNDETITLEAPKPISGNLEIISSPLEADIYIDGRNYGQTPNVINELLIGTHELKLTKQGYAELKKTITIKEGETLTINEKLQANSQQLTANNQQTLGNNNVASGKINGHEYVDLGLSVKWATCNVGANSPEDYGNFYAWGETTTKSDYSSSNSKTYNKSINDIKGNSQYDAARANWGGTWRLPTEAELEELEKNCTWQWITQNGVKGYKVTSKKNGNSIFLPAAGCRYGSSRHYAGEGGNYWSSTPHESRTYDSCSLGFGGGGHDMFWDDRYYGQSVRPVSE